ncbi:MAG: hypothetical protein EPO40_01725 [Myxococcaceae bacterium]|nr:MAG: hypothetical protein EPO40_01725 [Myxococcaceae bacterium]
MTAEARKSAENGIWMCYTHGKQIDTDEVRYSVAMLQQWKELAKRRARIEQESHGKQTLTTEQLRDVTLVDDVVVLTDPDGNQPIGEAIDLSCLPLIWGKDLADGVRDLLVELYRNARTHGKATTCSLEISARTVRLTDNGDPFDPWSLAGTECGGGSTTVSYFGKQFGGRVVIANHRKGSANELAISRVFNPTALKAVTTCVADVKPSGALDQFNPANVDACGMIYVLLPTYLVISDVYRLPARLKPVTELGKRIVFVVSKASEFVRAKIPELFPGSTILLLD